MALTPGLLLASRYRLNRRIAIGGMGEVWAATDRTLGRSIAVKILKPELTSDPEFVDRFRVEAQITASLNNPGIAAVYDYGETSSHPDGPKDTAFLVMELVSGEALSSVLARTPRIPVDRVLDVLEQSGRALQEAHARGLIHRDIKPGNILITPAGQVKITDFGIAKVAHQVPVTKSGLVMGTAQYLSPEQAGGGAASPASDVYALAIVGYECLAGFRPFSGDNPVIVAMAQIRNAPPPLPADVPAPVAELIMHGLIKDPGQRYPDGESFANAVAAVRAGFARPPVGAFSLSKTGPHPTAVFPSVPVNVPSGPAVAPRNSPPRSSAPAFNPSGGTAAPVRQSARPPQNRPAFQRAPRHTGVAVLIALLILILVVAGGTAMYLSAAAGPGQENPRATNTAARASTLDALQPSAADSPPSGVFTVGIPAGSDVSAVRPDRDFDLKGSQVGGRSISPDCSPSVAHTATTPGIPGSAVPHPGGSRADRAEPGGPVGLTKASPQNCKNEMLN